MEPEPEPFVVLVREDEIADAALSDDELLRELMHFIWLTKLEEEAHGIPVSGKDDLDIIRFTTEIAGGIPVIRAVGLAKRKEDNARTGD